MATVSESSSTREEMGTFVGHIVPGLAFTFLGLWHTLNTIHSHKSTPSTFRSRTWYPLKTSFPAIKQLELILLLSFSALAAASQALDYPLLRLAFTPDGLEHATIFAHVAIYASVALAAEIFRRPPETLDGLIGLLAVSAFGQEVFLLHFHSTDHVGLEGHYHWLLQVTAVVSLLSTMCSTGVPTSFCCALVRSGSVLMQGLWFIDMGFVLWGPGSAPTGCSKVAAGGDHGGHGAVVCLSEGNLARAKALGNLQFSWILAGIMVFVSCLCLRTSANCMNYRRLQEGGGGTQSGVEGEGLKQVDVI